MQYAYLLSPPRLELTRSEASNQRECRLCCHLQSPPKSLKSLKSLVTRGKQCPNLIVCRSTSASSCGKILASSHIQCTPGRCLHHVGGKEYSMSTKEIKQQNEITCILLACAC